MARKVLLSFLGNNEYVPCVYQDATGESRPVRYILDALGQMYCSNWSENDVIYIFLTKDAREKNWDGENYKNGKDKDKFDERGLGQTLYEAGLKCQIIDYPGKGKDLPEGYSEQDIWAIFNLIFDVLQSKDEVYLDITNGFRSLPMLGMALADYARFLKKVNIVKIFYGAFEALGPAYKVRTEIPLPADRKAPLLDLISFAELQRWTVGASDFIKFGNSDGISSMTKESKLEGIVADKKQLKKANMLLTQFSIDIEWFTKRIAVNRGQEIIEGVMFTDMKETLAELSKFNFVAPLKPLYNEVAKKIDAFERNELKNGFAAVEWCIQHQMIQQGITMLQETLLTYMMGKVKDLFPDNFNIFDYPSREAVRLPTYKKSYNEHFLLTHYIFKNKAEWYPAIKALFKHPVIKKYRGVYNSMRDPRNSINHGGFTDKIPDWETEIEEDEIELTPEGFLDFLVSTFEKVKQLMLTD